jgi:hypothetical protein
MPWEREDFLSLELIQGIGKENMDRLDCIKTKSFCMSKLNHPTKGQKHTAWKMYLQPNLTEA